MLFRIENLSLECQEFPYRLQVFSILRCFIKQLDTKGSHQPTRRSDLAQSVTFFALTEQNVHNVAACNTGKLPGHLGVSPQAPGLLALWLSEFLTSLVRSQIPNYRLSLLTVGGTEEAEIPTGLETDGFAAERSGF